MAEEKEPCEHIKKLIELLKASPLEIIGVDDYDLCSSQVVVECHECDRYMDLDILLRHLKG